MIRLVLILIVAGLIALGAVWLADHAGVLTLTIDGYEFRTSAALAAVLLLVIVALLFALLRLAPLLLAGPSRLGAFFGRRRASKAYRALSRGLIATAAGDRQGAVGAAREA